MVYKYIMCLKQDFQWDIIHGFFTHMEDSILILFAVLVLTFPS